ncbi:MAG: lytic murein transglycosylase [Alphaproteobacteria bacterium]|nr:lytic murein transglycosylase [Alphaproteobacteria bacterium]
MQNKKLLLLSLILAFITACSNNNNNNFSKYKNKLQQQTIKLGYNVEFTNNIFSKIHFDDSYSFNDQKQFTKKQSFNQYYNNAVNNLRIKKAKNKLQEHHNLLNNIFTKYQVQPEYIIALFAIESNFGTKTGDFPVLNSLFNLAYEGRRRKFFEYEFFAALKLIKENKLNPNKYEGSWAGASGQCQFMPSTYLEYATDYNLDGKRDIWHDKEDVFASIANYLHQINWNPNLPFGYEIIASPELISYSKKIKNKKISLATLTKKFPINIIQKTKFNQIELTEKVNLITYDGRLFILFNNFHVIKEWNNSNYFALTIGLLAEKIK